MMTDTAATATQSRLRSEGRMSNTGYHQNGKPTWWARIGQGADARFVTTVDGVHVCTACAVYTTHGGELVCGRQTEGFTRCHVCDHAIEWGYIQTGARGASNYRTGACDCGPEAWLERESGGWGRDYAYLPDDEEGT